MMLHYNESSLPRLIDRMKTQQSDPEAMRFFLRLVDAPSNPRVASLMRDKGALEMTLSAAHNYPADQELQRYGCGALGQLMLGGPDAVSDLCRGGAIQVIVSAMKRFPQDVELQTNGLRGMNTFTMSGEYVEALMTAGGAEVMITALRNHGHSHQTFAEGGSVVQYALSDLSNIVALVRGGGQLGASISATAPFLVSKGCVEAVNAAMEGHTDDTKVLGACIQLMCMISENNDTMKTELGRRGGLKAILTAMSKHTGDLEVQRESLKAVGRISHGVLTADIIMKNGGLDGTIWAMKYYQDDNWVQQYCCATLWNLALAALSPDPENQWTPDLAPDNLDHCAIVAAGSIPLIVTALLRFTTVAHVPLHEEAIGALRHLVVSDDTVELLLQASGTEAIQKIMTLHPKRVQLQMHGAELLQTISGLRQSGPQSDMTAVLATQLENLQADLKTGDTVIISGLISTTGRTMNGEIGVIQGFNDSTGRFTVAISPNSPSKPSHTIDIKKSNLTQTNINPYSLAKHFEALHKRFRLEKTNRAANGVTSNYFTNPLTGEKEKLSAAAGTAAELEEMHSRVDAHPVARKLKARNSVPIASVAQSDKDKKAQHQKSEQSYHKKQQEQELLRQLQGPFGMKLERLDDIKVIKSSTGGILLHDVTSAGHVQVLELIANHKSIQIDEIDAHGHTAYLLACGHHNLACMKVLAAAGADVSATTKHGATALMVALSGDGTGQPVETCPSVIQSIVDAGVDVSLQDHNGNSAFHFAAMLGDCASMEILLEAGFDIETKNTAGETGMHIAMHTGDGDGNNYYGRALERVKAVRFRKNAAEAKKRRNRKKKLQKQRKRNQKEQDQKENGEAFHLGSVIVIAGLTRAPELNGQSGLIEDFDHASGRYLCRLDDREKLVALKPINCRASSQQEPATNSPTITAEPAVEPGTELAEDNGVPPYDYLCPIACELMVDPVTTVVGQTYERAVIKLWLESHRTDPMTNQKMDSVLLVDNDQLRGKIVAWKLAHPEYGAISE